MSISKPARALLTAFAFAAAPLAASAQDASPPAQDDGASACGDADSHTCPTPSPQSEPEAPRPHIWTLTASTGITARDDGPNGSYEAVSLARSIGRGYLRAGLMRYHGTLLQADTALPSDYFIGTLSAGGNFDNWVVDGWASYGRQSYGKISTSTGNRPSTGAAGSGYHALGGDFGRIFTLAPDWYLTPTAAASYAHGKLLRPAPTGTGLVDLETDEPTWSGSAAIRIDHAFGARRGHYVGLSLSRNWTSNAVSQVRFGPPPEEGGTASPSSLDSEHFADAWLEAGMTANMRLGGDLTLDLYASRSFDALAGNTTSAGVSLRKSF